MFMLNVGHYADQFSYYGQFVAPKLMRTLQIFIVYYIVEYYVIYENYLHLIGNYISLNYVYFLDFL